MSDYYNLGKALHPKKINFADAQRRAAAGDVSACHVVAWFHENGCGVTPVNTIEAMARLDGLTDPLSVVRFSLLLHEHFEQDIEDETSLGQTIQEQCKQDIETHIAWIQRQAAAHHVQAQVLLAKLYHLGIGVDQSSAGRDYAFGQAAAAKDLPAQAALVELFDGTWTKGGITEREALKYRRATLDAKLHGAQMHNAEQAEKKRILSSAENFWQDAVAQNATQSILGYAVFLHKHGKHREKDIVVQLKRAAALRHPDGVMNIARCMYQGLGVEWNPAQAFADVWGFMQEDRPLPLRTRERWALHQTLRVIFEKAVYNAKTRELIWERRLPNGQPEYSPLTISPVDRDVVENFIREEGQALAHEIPRRNGVMPRGYEKLVLKS